MRLIIRRFRFGCLLVVSLYPIYKSPGVLGEPFDVVRISFRCRWCARCARWKSHVCCSNPFTASRIDKKYSPHIPHYVAFVFSVSTGFDGDWLSFTHPCRYYSSSGKSSNVTELSVVILATLITFDLCQWLQHSAHGLSWNSDIFSQLHCNWPSKHVGWNSESRLVDKFRPVFSDEKGCFFLLVRESHYSKIYWHDYGVTV